MIRRIDALARRCAWARAFIAGFALAAGFGATGYHIGHDAGRTEGRIEAHRETDRVLHELRAAFDGLVDLPAEAPAPESRHTATGDAP